MEWLRTKKRKYSEIIFGTSRGVIDSNISGISKLNESVYEFYRPEDGTSPNVEVVLFHGVYLGDSNHAYLETWTSSDGSTSHCWPKTWVAERFPRARILSVSYDSSIEKGPKQGRMDLYCVAENLIQDLTDRYGNVGVRDSCPLILVGHGFGGLVIKAVCLEASYRGMETFLCNVKAILFYSTAQLGLSNVPAEFDGALAETLGWGNQEIARLNYRFQKVRQVKKWVTKAILAGHPSKEPRLDPKEASVRFDVDEFYTAREDIDTICRPREDTSITVTYLTGLLSDCIASRSGPGGTTAHGVGVKLTSSLLFENDGYYVPMERSRDEVRNALNSPDVRIVVLHGLPGSGKSSLAKHLALWFADESNMHCQDQGTKGTSSDSGQRSCFTDGVVYLTCGTGADVISKQQELLQNFNVPLNVVDNEVGVDGNGLRRKLVKHLKDLKALVILDDIWEGRLFEKLLVPGEIKYLVTTQVTTLWSGCNVKNVPIQNVCQDDARKILGNYGGFCNGMIPEELMEIADELIKATESHPLALTTLAMVVNHGGRTFKEEWREVRDNFRDCLTSENHAIGFGETYPRTVYAAMTSAVELLDDSEKSLLYTIVLFQGSIIPECVVQLFLQSTRPERSWETTYSARKRLESLGLVQRAFFSIPFDASSPHKQRVFVIHGLRKQFILSKMLDSSESDVSITKFVVKDGSLLHQHEGLECERDLATVLCSMFGGTIIQEAAIRKLGTRFIWSDSRLLIQLLRPLLSWLLSVMVEETQGAADNQLHTAKAGAADNQLHTAKAATEVFWMLFDKGELDDNNMSFLLRGKSTRTPSGFLMCLSYIFTNTQHALCINAIPCSTKRIIDLFDYTKDTEELVQFYAIQTIRLLAYTIGNGAQIVKNFTSCLRKLVLMLAPNVDDGARKLALMALVDLAGTHEILVLMEILETPSLLERVVMLLSKDTEGRCEEATKLIYNLADGPLRLPIVRFPSCLERLVTLLALDVDEGAQKEALKALTKLANTHESLVLMEIMGTPSLLESMVMLLSKDMEGRCEVAATFIGTLAKGPLRLIIVRFPLCLEQLVALLALDVDEGVQKEALKALTNLASTRENLVLMQIMGTPDLLKSVVILLSKDMEDRCVIATALIRNLAAGPLPLTIAQFPSCLERLVALLALDVDEGTQKEALKALTNLACTRETLVLMAIMGTPSLLESVTMFLSKHMEGKCEVAATLIRNLATGALRLTIVRFPLCLERLVTLLAPDVDEGAQKEALKALVNLSTIQENSLLMEIIGTLGLLENVVMLLSKEMEDKCEVATTLISNLAQGALQLTIVRFPLCLERLVALLATDVDEGTQKVALKALTNLTNTKEIPLLMEIMGTPSLLESVVMLLFKDMEGMCEGAATLISNLAKGTSKLTIAQFPLCLERLVALLAIDVDQGAQKGALKALINLASTRESHVLMEIMGTPGLLESVVMFLSKDMEGRCEMATMLISNLATGASHLTILQFPSCLERLVALLAPHVDEVISKWAILALASLGTYDENKVDQKMLVMGGFLGDSALLPADNFQATMLASQELSIRGVIEGLLTTTLVTGNACSELYMRWSDADLLVKDYPRALIYITKALEVNVDNGLLLQKRGFLQWCMGDFPRALADFNKALEVNANDGFIWQERGVLRRFLGDFPGALEDLNKALQLNPNHYEVLKHRGLVKFMMKDEEGAHADVERAILVKPSRVDSDSYGQDGCLGVLSIEFLGYALK